MMTTKGLSNEELLKRHVTMPVWSYFHTPTGLIRDMDKTGTCVYMALRQLLMCMGWLLNGAIHICMHPGRYRMNVSLILKALLDSIAGFLIAIPKVIIHAFWIALCPVIALDLHMRIKKYALERYPELRRLQDR